MNNQQTLTLIHGAAEDAEYRSKYYQSRKDWKKKYNAEYYAKHKDYWKEYYKRAGVQGTIDLKRMNDESAPKYRRQLAIDALKRGDFVEAAKQASRAGIEQDISNMYEAVASGDRARRAQEAVRSAKSGQSRSGSLTEAPGGQSLKYMLKDAANKFGKTWKSGASDIINLGKKIADKIKYRDVPVKDTWSTFIGGQPVSGESGYTIRTPRFGSGETQIINKWSTDTRTRR